MPLPDLFSVKGKKSNGADFNLNFDTLGSSRFISPADVRTVGGTWTLTRNSANNISLNKTAAADTTYLYLPLRDLTKPVKASGLYNGTNAADRGMKITSVDLIYLIVVAPLVAHSARVDLISFSNGASETVAAHGGALSGSLAVSNASGIYVTTLTLGTPAFDQTKYGNISMEVAVNAGATSVYAFYGAVVNYEQNTI